MILLTSTSDKLQIVTSVAAAIDVHTSWVDNTATAVTPGRTNTAIVTAATIDVVAAPAASTQRNVKTLHVRNKHATLATDVTVQHTDGTTVVQLYKATLVAGGMLQYVDDEGFSIPAAASPGTVGGGNVSNSGTPITGQLAQWADATHIQGVDSSSLGFLTAAVAAATYQPLDADLTALAALAGTNTIYYRSAANTWAAVTIGANLTFSGGTLAATGGGGTGNVSASGAPLSGQLAAWVDGTHIQGIDVATLPFQPLDGDLTAIAALAGTNVIYYRSGTNNWVAVTIGANLSFTSGTLAATGLQADDATLTALAGLDATAGLVEQTGADAFTKRALGVGAGTSVPTRADTDARYAPIVHVHAESDITGLVADLAGKQPLDADLTAIAALAGTNVIYYRSAADTWAAVTIGANLTFSGGTLAATIPAAAPVGAEYITSTSDATLTAERVLTDTATVTWDRTTAGQIKANAAGGGGSAVVPGFIYGLACSNNVADATNDIDIAIGSATDAGGTVLMALASALGKRLDAAWTVGGTPAATVGGLDTGAVQPTGWYYVWLIQRTDTGVVDALFSLSDTAPTLPANYTKARRVWAVRRSAGVNRTFRQAGDRGYYIAPTNDFYFTFGATRGPGRLFNCPPNMRALFRGYVNATTPITLLFQPTFETAANASPSGAGVSLYQEVANQATAADFEVETDAVSNIQIYASTGGSMVSCTTKGWVDRRGQDAAEAALAFTPGGIVLNGSTYFYKPGGSDWIGSANSNVGVLSIWLRPPNASRGNQQFITSSESDYSPLLFQTDNRVRFVGSDNGGGVAADIVTANPIPADGAYHHVVFAWNTATGVRQCYVDGVSALGTNSGNTNQVYWTRPGHVFGSRWSGSDIVVTNVAEFYLNTTTFLDLSVPANLAKFRTAGHPAFLGKLGELPAGTQPMVHFSHSKNSNPSDFVANRGTGGDYLAVAGLPLVEDATAP